MRAGPRLVPLAHPGKAVVMEKVEIVARSTSQFRGVLGTEHHRALDDALARLWELLAGRRLWHINSTSAGGGVAEMLTSLLPYPLGAGIDVRWLVVNGDERFFEVNETGAQPPP